MLLATAMLIAACGGGSSPSVAGAQPSMAPSTPTPTAAATTRPATAPPGTATATAAATTCPLPPQPSPPSSLPADYATALAFAPDGRLFYTERGGSVRVVQGGVAHLFATVSTVTTEAGGGYSERGLLSLAISPSFTLDHFVFAFYSDADRAHQHVIRWRDCAGVASPGVVIVTLPSGADCCHKGGRLAFGADGMLYVTLGDEHTASAAQNTADVRGKVLRYNPDGTVPPDNPFGPTNPVWAYGLRNPFGIAVSATGELAVTSNGPSGDDGSPATGYDTVVTGVRRGAGYEWPNCYGYSHPLASSTCGGGELGPDWSSETSTVVPTGATFVDGLGPAGYAGHLVFCTFNRGMLVLSPGSPHAAVNPGPAACRLDVVEGPDHALWFSDQTHISRLG